MHTLPTDRPSSVGLRGLAGGDYRGPEPDLASVISADNLPNFLEVRTQSGSWEYELPLAINGFSRLLRAKDIWRTIRLSDAEMTRLQLRQKFEKRGSANLHTCPKQPDMREPTLQFTDMRHCRTFDGFFLASVNVSVPDFYR